MEKGWNKSFIIQGEETYGIEIKWNNGECKKSTVTKEEFDKYEIGDIIRVKEE